MLFDFGLSKLVRIKAGVTAHKLTGQTGAPSHQTTKPPRYPATPLPSSISPCHWSTPVSGAIRYMAPEVAMSQPYGTSAEVYSFAIILWQMISHEVPYAGLGSTAFHRRVVQEGFRPPLGNKAWPAPLSQLLAECWSRTPTERPAIEEVTPPRPTHYHRNPTTHTPSSPTCTLSYPLPLTPYTTALTRLLLVCRCADDCARFTMGSSSSREGDGRLRARCLRRRSPNVAPATRLD